MSTVKAICLNKDIANDKYLLLAGISFIDLNNIVKFTNRTSDCSDPFENLVESESNELAYYQRSTNKIRVDKIEKFILSEFEKDKSLSTNLIFPSSMIIALDSNVEYDIKADGNELVDMELPTDNESKESCLIVDGQHRLAGMRQLYFNAKKQKVNSNLSSSELIDKIEKYKFNCSLLINYDLWEQSQIFASVNFNQKPVSKSLYYDIFGSNPENNVEMPLSDIYLAHMLTKHLNSRIDSPIYNFVKMLGNGKGYFSQAFFVEAIFKHFSTKGAWKSILIDYQQGGTKHRVLPKILKSYLGALKEMFNKYWPIDDVKYEGILCKTTGMGALIRLLGYMYTKMEVGAMNGCDLIDFESITEEELKDIYKKIFGKISKDKAKSLFSKDGEFAGSGSLGSQSKLYKKLLEEIEGV